MTTMAALADSRDPIKGTFPTIVHLQFIPRLCTPTIPPPRQLSHPLQHLRGTRDFMRYFSLSPFITLSCSELHLNGFIAGRPETSLDLILPVNLLCYTSRLLEESQSPNLSTGILDAINILQQCILNRATSRWRCILGLFLTYLNQSVLSKQEPAHRSQPSDHRPVSSHKETCTTPLPLSESTLLAKSIDTRNLTVVFLSLSFSPQSSSSFSSFNVD